jgi:hypothetical protein
MGGGGGGEEEERRLGLARRNRTFLTSTPSARGRQPAEGYFRRLSATAPFFLLPDGPGPVAPGLTSASSTTTAAAAAAAVASAIVATQLIARSVEVAEVAEVAERVDGEVDDEVDGEVDGTRGPMPSGRGRARPANGRPPPPNSGGGRAPGPRRGKTCATDISGLKNDRGG